MSAIRIDCSPVYFAPSKGRRYLTPKAAADAESRALLDRKYPAEKPEWGANGGLIDGGWHWSQDPEHVAAQKRLAQRLLKRLRITMKARQP